MTKAERIEQAKLSVVIAQRELTYTLATLADVGESSTLIESEIAAVQKKLTGVVADIQAIEQAARSQKPQHK